MPVYKTNQEDKSSACILWDPRNSIQNPAYRCRLIKLFCRTGYHLTVSPAGFVRGQNNINDQIGTGYLSVGNKIVINFLFLYSILKIKIIDIYTYI